MSISFPLYSSKFSRFLLKDEAKHFHLPICRPPCGGTRRRYENICNKRYAQAGYCNGKGSVKPPKIVSFLMFIPQNALKRSCPVKTSKKTTLLAPIVGRLIPGMFRAFPRVGRKDCRGVRSAPFFHLFGRFEAFTAVLWYESCEFRTHEPTPF